MKILIVFLLLVILLDAHDFIDQFAPHLKGKKKHWKNHEDSKKSIFKGFQRNDLRALLGKIPPKDD